MFTFGITKNHLFTEEHDQKALKVTGTDIIVHPSSSNFLSNPILKSIWSLKNTIKFPQMIKSLFIEYSFCCSAINSSLIYYYLTPLTLWQTASFPDGGSFCISTHSLYPHLFLTHMHQLLLRLTSAPRENNLEMAVMISLQPSSYLSSVTICLGQGCPEG